MDVIVSPACLVIKSEADGRRESSTLPCNETAFELQVNTGLSQSCSDSAQQTLHQPINTLRCEEQV